jgi:hypothetical protein
MNRIIPKNTNINRTIFKGFTLGDFVVAGIAIGILLLAAGSDIEQRFFLVSGMALMFGLLFIPINSSRRVWNSLSSIVAFIFSKKYYKGEMVKKLVPYTAIREDGLISYSNCYSKVIAINQLAFELFDEDIQNNKIRIFENVLRLLDTGFCLDIVKIDRPLVFDEFSKSLYEQIKSCKDPVKLQVLEERMIQISLLNNIEKIYRPFFYLVFYSNKEQSLLDMVASARQLLQTAEIDGGELDWKETTNFLKYCHTRFFDERDIDDITLQQCIDYIAPKEIKFTSTGYMVDKVQAFTFGVSNFPLFVGNAWGASIFSTDNTKVVLKIRPVDPIKATRRLDRAVVELGTRSEDLKKASEMINNDNHLETMIATLESLETGNEALFDCTFTITAFNNNVESASAFRKDLKHTLSKGGFTIDALLSEQLPSFLTANISPVRSMTRLERGITSTTASAVFPFVFTSLIDIPNGILLGYNTSPVFLDISKRDNDHTNGNCLVLGKSGSGKSYATKTIITNLYADGWKAFVLDVENEFSQLCNAVAGTKIDVGAATHGMINPFHIYGLLTDDGGKATNESIFNNHLNALESFFNIVLSSATIDSDTMEYLNYLVVETYHARGIDEHTDCSDLAPEDFPTFNDLEYTVREKLEDAELKKNPIILETLRHCEIQVKKFSTGGRYSSLWNGVSTLKADAKFTVFNFQSLLSNKNQTIANAQMLLVMRFLEQELICTRDKNQKTNSITHTVIVAEEAHAFTDPKFPVALDFLYQMTKRIRKYAGSLFFITQNLGDGTANQEVTSKTRAIFSNCQYSFIFNLAPTDIQSLVTLYANSGGINSTEQEAITNNPRGSCFLISASRERSSIAITATDVVENMFMTAAEKNL